MRYNGLVLKAKAWLVVTIVSKFCIFSPTSLVYEKRWGWSPYI